MNIAVRQSGKPWTASIIFSSDKSDAIQSGVSIQTIPVLHGYITPAAVDETFGVRHHPERRKIKNATWWSYASGWRLRTGHEHRCQTVREAMDSSGVSIQTIPVLHGYITPAAVDETFGVRHRMTTKRARELLRDGGGGVLSTQNKNKRKGMMLEPSSKACKMEANPLSDSDDESIPPALPKHLLQYAFLRLKNGKFDVIQFVKHAKWTCPLEARASNEMSKFMPRPQETTYPSSSSPTLSLSIAALVPSLIS
ncbi:hypothetical protein BJ741DRAFT_695549 [Chytriomyces cf. hyalinus JEL632]|nr:hypothetical protein BJ741DRAFT_695549 [Chytriomyces cf. hyalinus JEL632]